MVRRRRCRCRGEIGTEFQHPSFFLCVWFTRDFTRWVVTFRTCVFVSCISVPFYHAHLHGIFYVWFYTLYVLRNYSSFYYVPVRTRTFTVPFTTWKAKSVRKWAKKIKLFAPKKGAIFDEMIVVFLEHPTHSCCNKNFQLPLFIWRSAAYLWSLYKEVEVQDIYSLKS